VVIRQQGNTITIDNDCLASSEPEASTDQGFGLGLQLTRQLCDKLGWTYHTDAQPHRHHVTLTIVPLA
jgi:hypothetical protein